MARRVDPARAYQKPIREGAIGVEVVEDCGWCWSAT